LNASIGVVYANSGIFYGNSVTGNTAIYGGVPGFTTLGSNVVAQFTGNVNSYSQINFENINNGNRASTDYIATADNGNDASNYVNMGIASSTYSYPDFSAYGPNDGYLHNNGGNLLINPETPGKIIKFVVGGPLSTDVVATMSNTAFAMTGTVSGTGNVSGGNLTTAGRVIATGNVQSSANVTGANLVASANLVSVGAVVSGNVTGGNLLTAGRVIATGNVSGGNVIAAANLVSVGAVVSGNVTGGNLLTAGLIRATSTITSSANISGANLVASANLVSVGAVVSGNVTGGNLLTAGLISATGNITGGNLVTPNLVSAARVAATGNVSGANISTASMAFNGSNVNSNAARITVNSASSDVDFAVNSDTTANVFYIDAGTGTISIGSSTQTTNAALAINATNSFLMPVGNTAQRPSVGVTGMLRFNSTLDAVEVYDTDSWATVGTPSFTVISDEQFDGDGVTVAFTLSEATTTASTIVSINGIVQIPTIAYSVGGGGNDTLTFTEAPENGDIIDVRILTTTTQVTSISNSPGNAIVSVSPTTAQVNITGDLSVNNIVNSGANGTGNIGNSTTYFNTVFAKATSAQYADLAEVYAADAAYKPGTVLSFGGTQEVTISTITGDARVAGVVSTNPSYVMNATLNSDYTAVVALTGRVPTLVSGAVVKGDMMVSAGNGRAVACATPAMGTVIGKALENHANGDGIIEVVVGRL
jgi:hypothetical protein